MTKFEKQIKKASERVAATTRPEVERGGCDYMVLGKICFAVNTVCLVFQIILVLRATVNAEKRENRKNTDYNSNNPIDFISRIPESRSFLVLLAVWAVVVCVAIITTA